jgi:hypothetical protein
VEAIRYAMGERRAIHGADRSLRQLRRRLKETAAPEVARGKLTEFIDEMASQGLGVHRKLNYLDHLLPPLADLEERFLRPTREDLQAFLRALEARGLSRAQTQAAGKSFHCR